MNDYLCTCFAWKLCQAITGGMCTCRGRHIYDATSYRETEMPLERHAREYLENSVLWIVPVFPAWLFPCDKQALYEFRQGNAQKMSTSSQKHYKVISVRRETPIRALTRVLSTFNHKNDDYYNRFHVARHSPVFWDAFGAEMTALDFTVLSRLCRKDSDTGRNVCLDHEILSQAAPREFARSKPDWP